MQPLQAWSFFDLLQFSKQKHFTAVNLVTSNMAQQIIAKQRTKRKREAKGSKPLGKIVFFGQIDEADVLLYLGIQRKVKIFWEDHKELKKNLPLFFDVAQDETVYSKVPIMHCCVSIGQLEDG